MTESDQGPFEQSIQREAHMTARLVSPGVVEISGFDGPLTIEQLRYARSILTRAILDLVKREQGAPLRLSDAPGKPVT